MTPMTETVLYVLSLLTVVGDVMVGVGVLLLLIKDLKKWRKVVVKWGLGLAGLVALIATSGSLYMSEIAGLEPCKLCWLQRVSMYPLVWLLGLAVYKKKKGKEIVDYVLGMSVVGGIIAGYHYMLQNGWVNEGVSCGVVGYSVSCAKRFVLRFGYVSIPMMALTAFGMILVIMLLMKKEEK